MNIPSNNIFTGMFEFSDATIVFDDMHKSAAFLHSRGKGGGGGGGGKGRRREGPSSEGEIEI